MTQLSIQLVLPLFSVSVIITTFLMINKFIGNANKQLFAEMLKWKNKYQQKDW